MKARSARRESANAEILGVVILIGIFAITAGIISATVLATPEAERVPAASIEITGSPGAIRITHLGGDPLPPNSIVRGTTMDNATEIKTLDDLLTLGGKPMNNGFSEVVDQDWKALVLVWVGNAGEQIVATWDPSGLYGPLGPSALSGGSVPSPIPTAVVPPPVQYPVTVLNITADFLVTPSAAGLNEEVQFMDQSTGNVTIDAWLWRFGDGSTSDVKDPVHSYGVTGSYAVNLTVWNLTTGMNASVEKPGCVQVSEIPFPVDFDISSTVGNTELTVVCTDRSGSLPTLWRWTATDPMNGIVTTVGPDNQPVALNQTFDPRIQPFTFTNPSGTANNTCSIKLEVWSPYFEGPISKTKIVTVGPPLQADFRTDFDNWTFTAGVYGAQVHFQDTSVGIPQEWEWDFGDGNTSTEQNPVHNFSVGPNEVKPFSVTLTARGWGQEDQVTHVLTIWPAVSARSRAVPTEGSAPLTVAFFDESTGSPDHWIWDFGDSYDTTDSFEQNPVHTFTQVGIYKVTLIAERSEPHSAAPQTSEIIILVGDEVTADFTADVTAGPVPLLVQFTDISTNAEHWTWEFGDGGKYLADYDPIVPPYEYSVPGNYTVKLTAYNDFRSDFEEKFEYISVYDTIDASFTATPRDILKGAPVQFNDTSYGNPYTYAWDFGDGTTSTDKNPVHTYSSAGVYTVSLTATNPLGPDTQSEIGYIEVFDQVHASFTADPTGGLTPLQVQFTDTSTGSPIRWSWDFGDGTTSTKQSPLHTYNGAGNYSVTLKAENLLSSHSTTAVNCIITVFGELGAQFETNVSAGPGPLTVQFNDTSSGNPVSWLWDFGDGTTSTERNQRNPVHTFSEFKTYDVTVTVHHLPDMDKTSSPHTITVYAPITAQFEVNKTSGAVPFTVQFTDTSAGAVESRLWNFGDGATSDGQNPTHTYTTPGPHTVTLEVWNNETPLQKISYQQEIIAYGIPDSAFTASPVTGVANLTVTFTDTSTGHPDKWDWDFGDGNTSDEQNPTHTYVKDPTVVVGAEAYAVTLTVGNMAGLDPTPATRTITVWMP